MQLGGVVVLDVCGCLCELMELLGCLVENLEMEWNDRAGSQINVELVVTRLQLGLHWSFLALCRGIEDIAPCAFGEDKQGRIDIGLCLDRELQASTKHNVIRLILVSLIVLREVEEQGSEEGASLLVADHTKLSIVITNQRKLGPHGVPYCVNIPEITVRRNIVEIVGLLLERVGIIEVSREWVESSESIPASAEFFGDITIEATNVGTGEWEAKHIAHHDSGDRAAHAFVVRESVRVQSC